jgi:HPt (histidine-containing phosphotransfer) domain-containing protein
MFTDTDAALAEVARVAHRLAGASFSAGAMLFGEAARALERQAKSDDPPPLLPFLEDLLRQYAATISAIDNFLSDSQPIDVHAGLPVS